MPRESWLWRIAPTWTSLLVYIFISLLLLLIASYKNWAGELVDSAAEQTIRDSISFQIKEFISSATTSISLSASTVSFLFWLVAGALVYTIGWFAVVAIKDVLNEIQISLIFVHPRSFSESKHWLGYISHHLLRVAALLILIGYSLMLINVLWPAILEQFTYGLLLFSPTSLFVNILPAVLLSALAIHIFTLLIQELLWRRSADYWRSLSNR